MKHITTTTYDYNDDKVVKQTVTEEFARSNSDADACTTLCEVEQEVDLLDAAAKLVSIGCLIITTVNIVRTMQRLK